MTAYYESHHLSRFGDIGKGNKELADLFFAWYGKVFEEGALTVREKALIALAVAHTVQCPYCIDAYTDECLGKGADLEQMTEAVHVATAIRGGASLVHGVQMLEQVERKLCKPCNFMHRFICRMSIRFVGRLIAYGSIH